jgi:hypothetical protein
VLRTTLAAAGLLLCWTLSVSAQQTDSTKQKSAAVADSIRLVRELEKAMADSGNVGRPAQAQAPTSYGPTNPRLLPDISAVGDLVGDLSPKGGTQEDGTRFGVREIELAVQAAVDPYFRGDIFLGVNDLEKIAVEEAFLTTSALPYGLELKLGRYLMPFGKQNLTHRHDLHTVEYPYVIQQFFAGEGLTGTGVWASKILAPFGFYQELQFTAVDLFGEQPEDLTTPEPLNKELSGMGYSARFRNYVDLSENSNFELSASAITGRRAQPLDSPVDGFNAVAARQTVVGADFTFRWRPLQQGLYKSFILQAEFMRQLNEKSPGLPTGATYAGPTRNVSGAYLFARYQLTRRLFVGSRADWLESQDPDGDALKAIAGNIEFFPSDFSKIIAQYERLQPGAGIEGVNRLLVQASFSLGPHRPHPF